MQPAPIPDSLAIASGQKQGVLVAAVVPGGTMEAIGALPNDVLMQFDGKAVPDWDGSAPTFDAKI